MLHDFLTRHRDPIIAAARAKVAARRVPVASPAELADGVPLFLSQLADVLREEQGVPPLAPVPATDERVHAALGAAADRVGDDLLQAGLTIAQVVEGYGDVCQAIAEHAVRMEADFGADEYRTLNLCLDVATARAVTAYARARDRAVEAQETERLGRLAHELRNLLSTAMLSFEALRRGTGVEGRTGALLGRSLRGLRDVIDRSLTEVRLAATLHHPERVELARFIEEIEVGAALDARAKGLELRVSPVPGGLAIHADRQLLASAASNLIQNAIKATPPGGRVSLSARQDAAGTFIDVEDECGGLADGHAEAMFRPFDRRGAERGGLGLGLRISREAVAANGGELRVRNLPGKGCVFTIVLPALVAAAG